MAGQEGACCFGRASRSQQAIVLSEQTNVLIGRVLDMIRLEAVS